MSITLGVRSKLKGCLGDWSKVKWSKVPLFLALFVDMLLFVSCLSLAFQGKVVNSVKFINSLKQAKTSLKNLSERDLRNYHMLVTFFQKLIKTKENFDDNLLN